MKKRNENKTASTKKRKAGYFVSGLSGVIVGALLMWLLMPSLANQLPGSTTEIQGQSSSTTGVKQTATVVTTDVTTAVEKVSEAVVGISNYQVIQNPLGGWFLVWSRRIWRYTAKRGAGKR